MDACTSEVFRWLKSRHLPMASDACEYDSKELPKVVLDRSKEDLAECGQRRNGLDTTSGDDNEGKGRPRQDNSRDAISANYFEPQLAEKLLVLEWVFCDDVMERNVNIINEEDDEVLWTQHETHSLFVNTFESEWARFYFTNFTCINGHAGVCIPHLRGAWGGGHIKVTATHYS